MLVAMDTALLPADALPKATLAEHEPSTAVRRAAAEASAERAASRAQAGAGTVARAERDLPATVEPSTATRRTAQAVVVFAVIGIVGVALGTTVVWMGRGTVAESASTPVPARASAEAPPAPAAVSAPPPSRALTTAASSGSTEGRSMAAAEGGPDAAEPGEVSAPTLAEVPTPPASAIPEAPPPEPRAPETEVASAAVEDDEEERGVLEMAAVPWGNIWLDGRRLGLGPITRRVSAGRHVVGAGPEDRALTTRTVTVRAGARERVLLRVGE
jgi:hypothetical protein